MAKLPDKPGQRLMAAGWPAPLRAAGQALLDLVYPPRCAGCGRHGYFLCPGCQDNILPVPLEFCPRCGTAVRVPAHLCPACRRAAGGLDGLLATGVFAAPLREAIHQLKYHGTRGLAGPLGERLASIWPALGEPADLVVPVPLHELRQAERGYNQAALLARIAASRLNLPLDERLLERQRATASQVGLGPRERRENVRAAFAACGNAQGLRVVLIDDVCTTGATLEACAAALRSAGVRHVWALVVARARVDAP